MDEKKILSRLQHLCIRREYCKSDIYKKALKYAENDDLLAEKLVNCLIADKFVDDLRYASAYVREKSTISGWGQLKIGYILRGKGIHSEIIDKAMEHVDIGKSEARLRKILESKYKLISGDKDLKIKLLRYAMSRGYVYGEVKKIIDEILN